MKTSSISVILSACNSTESLEKILIGYDHQTLENFEVVIADDGSSEETKALVKKLQEETSFKIIHVYQENKRNQKFQILNKALMICNGDYIIMSTGACIPRADFIEIHFKKRELGYFLSGEYLKLPIEVSKAITKKDIVSGQCFLLDWLKNKGLPSSIKNNKLINSRLTSKLLNTVTPTRSNWNPFNFSGWKTDVFAVNGFDERMQYNKQVQELEERLTNYGLKGKQLSQRLICLHLNHAQHHKTKASLEKNSAITRNTKLHKVTKTAYGIKKLKA